MKIALVGCGYVADFHLATLPHHHELGVVGAYDRDTRRMAAFCEHWGVDPYDDLQALLDDDDVPLVLNLTNPRSHYDVTRALLEAGKHVYTEKPLAMDYAAAAELVEIAHQLGRRISGAPCSLLGPTARTLWKSVRDGAVGRVRLAYASFDTGILRNAEPWRWRSASGAPWPVEDEVQVGCTFEHAGYFLTWLCAFFGPVRHVTSHVATLVAHEHGLARDPAPDFSTGVLEFDGGIVARVTTSEVAPIDRSMLLAGEEGSLYVRDIRDDWNPVYLSPSPGTRVTRALEYRIAHWQSLVERLLGRVPWRWGGATRIRRRLPFTVKEKRRLSGHYKPVDFLRGPAEMAAAIIEGRPHRPPADFLLHVVEVTEALQQPERFGCRKTLRSEFEPFRLLDED